MPQGEAAKHVLLAYLEEGMEPLDILRSSTYLSAKFMGKENQLGVIKKGAFADMVAVKGDVEEDFEQAIFDLVFVMKDGEIYVDTEGFVEEIYITEEMLESYVGRYELAEDLVIIVSKAGMQLKAKAEGREEYEFMPKSSNVFYAKGVDIQITFNTNEEGKVIGLTLLAGGDETTGPKVEE